MWSLACVCAEMYLGLPLFPGVSQHNQLTRIVEMFGLPPEYLLAGKHGTKYFTTLNSGINASAVSSQLISQPQQQVYSSSTVLNHEKSAVIQTPPDNNYYNIIFNFQ